MSDTTQDAKAEAVIAVLSKADQRVESCTLFLSEMKALLAYIAALEEIRDFHQGELAERNGPVD